MPTAVREQTKWAVRLQMRELPPASLVDAAHDPRRWGDIDPAIAVSAFSWDVSHGDDAARWDAVNALAWLDDHRAISPLIRALADCDHLVRRVATDGLRWYSPLPEWTLEPLILMLDDPSAFVRAGAALTIGQNGGRIEPSALARCLTDASPDVREATARAFSELGKSSSVDSSVAPAIASLLKDTSPRVAYAAYWALGWQGGSTWNGRRTEFRCSDWGQQVWRSMTCL